MSTQAINPDPFVGDVHLVNVNNPGAQIDWKIEKAEDNFIKLRNESGYIEHVVWSGNGYTPHGTRAMRFLIEDAGEGIYKIRAAGDANLYYTHKGGNFVLHEDLHKQSQWTITKKPVSFEGKVHLVNVNNPGAQIDWTVEKAEGNFVKLRNESGYIEHVVWSGNGYTPHGTRAMRFVIEDNGNNTYKIRAVGDARLYYTHKGGNFVLHEDLGKYSEWQITQK